MFFPDKKMSCLFRAKTQEGFTLKILSELLQNIIKIACFQIDSDGIKLCMVDSHHKILVDIFLYQSSFEEFTIQSQEPLYIGVNLNHLHKMLKSIKKKDAIAISIPLEEPNKMHLTIYPKEGNRVSTSIIHIQDTQNIMVSLPDGYSMEEYVSIPSSEYQRSLKDMNHINNVIQIQMFKEGPKVKKGEYSLKLDCLSENIFSKSVLFGKEENTEKIYNEKYDLEQFIKTLKITGLCKTMKIYCKKNLPLYIEGNVNSLGKIKIFIKSQGL